MVYRHLFKHKYLDIDSKLFRINLIKNGQPFINLLGYQVYRSTIFKLLKNCNSQGLTKKVLHKKFPYLNLMLCHFSGQIHPQIKS